MFRGGRVCIAAVVTAATSGCLVACELYSLDGLTHGDAGDAGASDVATDVGEASDGPGGPDAEGDADAAPGTVDAGDAGADAPSDAPTPYRIVFVTSQAGPPGSLAAADTICQKTATQYGLPGTYLAWLSDSYASPVSRMTQSTRPYVLPDRTTVVASNWTQLVSGNLAHPINESAQASTVASGQACNGNAGYYVWTGTTAAGALWNSYTCSDWSSSSAGNLGGVGDALARNGDWTQWCQAVCNAPAGLYCVEQ